MSTVSFVVLHYGDIKVTQKCIDSILELDKQEDISIVIIDNDYQKSATEREDLKKQYTDNANIEIVQMMCDIGFSKANNEGYSIAKKKYNPDYIIVTNNDIVFKQKDFVDRINNIYENHPYEILSPDIVSCETGQHQSPISMQGRSLQQVSYTIWMNAICLKLFPVLYPLLQKNYDKTKSEKIDMKSVGRKEDIVPCGACIVVSRNFVEREDKIFTPETHFYYEEYILHERCRKAGYRIVFDPMVQVFHGDGVATKNKNRTPKRKLEFVMEETMKSARIYRMLLRDNPSK